MDWLYNNWMFLTLTVAVVIAMIFFARSRAPRAEGAGSCCSGAMERKTQSDSAAPERPCH